MKRILICGGSGYGNLGDEAILLETLKLIRAELPDASMTVMSYDPPCTRLVLKGVDAEVVPSIHLHLSGDAAHKRFANAGKPGRRYPLKSAIRRAGSRFQVRPYLMARKAASSPLFLAGLRNCFSRHFGDTDVMVMSGGGYMNWKFMDSLVAHSFEPVMANDQGAGIMLVGQSIGPLRANDPYYRPAAELALQGIAMSHFISVRDPDSSRELAENGIDAEVVPDLALAREHVQLPEHASETLGIVPGALPKSCFCELADRLHEALVKTGLALRIIVSRLWESDIDCAHRLHRTMLDLGDASELMVPGTVDELQDCLSDNRAVISMNMHGLILAWRAGVPVVALSEHAKTRAFMDQAGSPDALADVRSALADDWLGRTVAMVIDRGVDDLSRERIAREVKEGFSRGFQACLSARLNRAQ